jgi:adenylyl cyclase-associated protein
MGVVPTITVDKVDNFELYLAKESLQCEIISSKSSGINISVPDSKTGDYVSLVTECVVKYVVIV